MRLAYLHKGPTRGSHSAAFSMAEAAAIIEATGRDSLETTESHTTSTPNMSNEAKNGCRTASRLSRVMRLAFNMAPTYSERQAVPVESPGVPTHPSDRRRREPADPLGTRSPLCVRGALGVRFSPVAIPAPLRPSAGHRLHDSSRSRHLGWVSLRARRKNLLGRPLKRCLGVLSPEPPFPREKPTRRRDQRPGRPDRGPQNVRHDR